MHRCPRWQCKPGWPYLEQVGSGCLVKEEVVGGDTVDMLCQMLLKEWVDVLQPHLVVVLGIVACVAS